MGKVPKNPIKKHLIEICRMHKRHLFEGNYCCLEEFILKNGRRFEMISSLPPDIKQGKAGNCFENAYWVALENKHKYYYCEGYVMANRNTLPVFHSWVVNRQREVIDPTCPFGRYYYGIAFRLSYVCQWLLKNNGHKSIIDNWMQGWPLLKDSKAEFKRHTIVPKR